LPRIATVVIEHRCQRLRCLGCGVERIGMLGALGPRPSAGRVDQILIRTADALEPPDHELVRADQRAGRLHIAETGWRLKESCRTLGRVHREDRLLTGSPPIVTRTAPALLGASTAIVASDRWWAYNHIPLARRQICWSRLQRDFPSPSRRLGR
jgi:hypothetical protein